MDRIAPSPLHALNRAVAEAYLHGPQPASSAWPPFFRKTPFSPTQFLDPLPRSVDSYNWGMSS
jgi:hypothetical protein